MLFSEVLRLDSELVRIGRGASAVRLVVGAALEALSASGGHHELGFSSLEAYARERCERTGRWAADTRALARKLDALPRIREALRRGEIGWSTAELLARHVTADSEVEWLERARGVTVRELRRLLDRENCGETAELGGAAESAADDEDEPTRELSVRATREDGWMFEGARKVAEAVLGPLSHERLLQALLAEGYSTLLDLAPEGARAELYEIEGLEYDVAGESNAQAVWCATRRRWQEEAEELCEPHFAVATEAKPRIGDETADAQCSFSTNPEALDREIRRLCAELSERDLALGIVAESARKAEVWRRLGFATEAQYARERVGVSVSSLKAKRILAGRAARVPELATALASGRVGYEAAYLLSRVVTPKTVGDWIRRAEQRTVKHLREEVEAAEVLIRMGLGRDQAPPSERTMHEFFEVERRIASGELFGDEPGASREGEPRGTGGSVANAGQMSGGRHDRRRVQRFGRLTLRWVLTEKTHRFWRALERAFAHVSSRVGRQPGSFLGFLCENFCRIWVPALRRQHLCESGEQPEFYGAYRRDVFRCSSPVCTRRDVTPHHLTFRSRGGGDEDENIASLCVWCHLRGVHEGRIAAEPPASRIRWRIGRSGTLRVEGRTRLTALSRATETRTLPRSA